MGNAHAPRELPERAAAAALAPSYVGHGFGAVIPREYVALAQLGESSAGVDEAPLGLGQLRQARSVEMGIGICRTVPPGPIAFAGGGFGDAVHAAPLVPLAPLAPLAPLEPLRGPHVGPLVTPGEAAEGRREIEALARAALAAAINPTSTRATYSAHVRNYETFCQSYGYFQWPATYQTLSSWFTHYVHKRGLSANTLGNMLSSVRNASRELVAGIDPRVGLDGLDRDGLRLTAIEHVRLQRVMTGLRKLASTAVKHKLPVTGQILDRAEVAVRSGNGGLLSARDSDGLLMLRTAQAGLLRVGEYTGVGTLLKSDVAELEAGGLRLHLRDCKTARPGEVQIVDLLDATLVKALKAVLARRQPGDSVFMAYGKDGAETTAPATRFYVTGLLRSYLSAAGIDACRYSSHSLRAGGATDLARFGASWSDIMRKGRWASPKSPMAYVAAADDFSQRLAALVARGGAPGPGAGPGPLEPPIGIAGPSLLPWRGAADKTAILRALLGQLVPLLGPRDAEVVVEGFASLADGEPSEKEPGEKEEEKKEVELPEGALGQDDGSGAAAEAAGAAGPGHARARNGGAAAAAAKRPRVAAGDRVQHRVVTDAAWEAYEWAKFHFQQDWISTSQHNTRRFRNKIADLRELVSAGLEEAAARADVDKAALWQAEKELGDSAAPFINGVD